MSKYKTLGNLQIHPHNIGPMTWDEANLDCEKLLQLDWRLPTKDELNEMYENRESIGGFGYGSYWSSSELDAYEAWYQYFYNGYQTTNGKSGAFYVRPVRNKPQETTSSAEGENNVQQIVESILKSGLSEDRKVAVLEEMLRGYKGTAEPVQEPADDRWRQIADDFATALEEMAEKGWLPHVTSRLHDALNAYDYALVKKPNQGVVK